MTTTATPDEPNNNEKALSTSDGLNMKSLTGDVIVAATRDLPDDHRDQLRWLYAFARENGWNLSRLADETKISVTTLYRAFNGTYAAKLDNLIERISSYRRLAEARGTLGDAPFAMTSIARKIDRTCEWALVSQSIAFIFGNRGLGKTLAFERRRETHNHGQTKLIRMPASAGVQLMMKEIAKACYISPNSCFDSLRERVLQAIDHTNLVIIDELHQVFLSYQRGSAIKCLEVIREIHDRTKCGMVLCGTTQLKKEISLGQHAEMLEQFTDRGVLKVQLPTKLPRADVLLIAKGYGLDDEPEGLANELVNELMEARSLRKFGKLLQAATRFASKTGERVTWAHFLKAHDILAKLERGSL
jgi:DNA transposition AAA+ family ATPase